MQISYMHKRTNMHLEKHLHGYFLLFTKILNIKLKCVNFFYLKSTEWGNNKSLKGNNNRKTFF